MKFIIFAVLTGLIGSVLAKPDQIKSQSPDGQLIAVFQRDSDRELYRLTLSTRDGKVRFQSNPIDATISQSIVWNATGDSMAFSAGTPFLMETFILFSQKGDYLLEKVPSPEYGWDNFYQIPRKWTNTLLTLELDGPHAGKAIQHYYKGTMVIDTSEKLKVVSENINTVEQGAAANP